MNWLSEQLASAIGIFVKKRMEVEKIEIKRKFMDIKYPYYKEVILPSVSAQIYNDGDLPTDETTVKEINYEVREVYNGKEKKKYLVKVADNEIFDDLFTLLYFIGDGSIILIESGVIHDFGFVRICVASLLNNISYIHGLFHII